MKEVFGALAENSKFTEVFARMVNQIYANPDIAKDMQAMLAEV